MKTRLPRLSSGAKRRTGQAVAAVLLIISLLATAAFAWRSYGSFLALKSAYELGVPSASTVRAWMTLDYVATNWKVPLADLAAGLGLAPDVPGQTTLSDIAGRQAKTGLEVVRIVQGVIAEDTPDLPAGSGHALSDDPFLSALLAWSYPALGLILLLGAIGAPVPTGITTVLAGVLAADGSMGWQAAVAVAVVASIAGDVVGYGIGRLAGQGFVDRHGHLLGYSGERRVRAEWLFHKWGGLTVLLTRTLVSHLSSLASLVAGLSRYPLAAFLVFAAVGRILWTAAYFGAGYFIGADIEASGSFLGNITGLAISVAVVVAALHHLVKHGGRTSQPT